MTEGSDLTISLLYEHEPLNELFQIAQKAVVENQEDKLGVAAALVLLEIKLDIYRQGTEGISPPPSLLRVMDFIKLKIHSDPQYFFEVSNDYDANMREKTPVQDLISGIFHLISDCLSIGFDLVSESIDLIQACLISRQFSKFVAHGLDKILLQLKFYDEKNEYLNELFCTAFAEVDHQLDEVLAIVFQKFPHSTFNLIVYPLFQTGFHNLFAGKIICLQKALTCALDKLKIDVDDENVFQVVQHIAKACGKCQNTYKELMSFSQKIGGLVGDRVFNLACELNE